MTSVALARAVRPGVVRQYIVVTRGRRSVQFRRSAHRAEVGRTLRGVGAPRRGRRGGCLPGSAGPPRPICRDQGAPPGGGLQHGVAPPFPAGGDRVVRAGPSQRRSGHGLRSRRRRAVPGDGVVGGPDAGGSDQGRTAAALASAGDRPPDVARARLLSHEGSRPLRSEAHQRVPPGAAGPGRPREASGLRHGEVCRGLELASPGRPDARRGHDRNACVHVPRTGEVRAHGCQDRCVCGRPPVVRASRRPASVRCRLARGLLGGAPHGTGSIAGETTAQACARIVLSGGGRAGDGEEAGGAVRGRVCDAGGAG